MNAEKKIWSAEKKIWSAEKQKLMDQLKKAEIARASLVLRTNLGKLIRREIALHHIKY